MAQVIRNTSLALLILLLFPATPGAAESGAWWNGQWTIRKPITIDTSAEGFAIDAPVKDAVVVLRLHSGNFQFAAARPDGADIQIVAEDGTTVLPHQIEKFDSLLYEAIVWVRVPQLKPDAKTTLWLYYGNATGEMAGTPEPAEVFSEETALVYHYAEQSGVPSDSSPNGNNAENGATFSPGALLGPGLRFLGEGVTVPANDSLKWEEAGTLTWTTWIKPAVEEPLATLFEIGDTTNGLVVGLENNAPFFQTFKDGTASKSELGEKIAVDAWKHLALTANGSEIILFVDGVQSVKLDDGLPALEGEVRIGGASQTSSAFVGEMDETHISRAALPAGAILFAAKQQGGSADAERLLQFGNEEIRGGHTGHNKVLEHLSLFGDIAHNMMFDGWAVIFCCAIMAIVGWSVALRKFFYINRIQKAGEEFVRRWSDIASDLRALDHSDSESLKSLGGNADIEAQRLMRQSPLYHIYHIGAEEIGNRIQNSKNDFRGLSARSIQAIRASLDAGVTRETLKLNGGLVFLTISIAGGPYVGLLGTVMGVMITFAVIAKTGEVEVNSIAPGIASALLATVAGLLVAIPALFIYSYLNSRIKDTITSMQMFIDEFVTKMAEFYPTEAEGGPAPVRRPANAVPQSVPSSRKAEIIDPRTEVSAAK